MKHINVVAAVITEGDKFFCVQRSAHKFDYLSFKYEFPGGKIEEGEKKQEALVREIQEELSIKVNVESELIEVYYEYPDFAITMSAFICTTTEAPTLTEHVSFSWLTKDELHKLDWAAADLPIVKKIVNDLL